MSDMHRDMHQVTCSEFSEQLSAHLELELDAAAAAGMDAHAATCAECGALLADLRALQAHASALPLLTPSHDLWNGIASRIDAAVVPLDTRRQSAMTAPRRSSWQLAAVAAGLMAVTSALTWMAASRRAPAVAVVAVSPGATRPAVPEAVTTTAPAPEPVITPAPTERREALRSSPAPTANVYLASAVKHAAAEAVYDREIRTLRRIIETRRNQIDPVTLAIIEKNLSVIDTAIAECKLALARDPASRFLVETLNSSLNNKVELLRSAAMLPTRS
ncbi:MAG: hypothetical protein JWO05_2665 [Gemmatimonadetes bacterium]|nr:hypothetical protein [Gemmatimonadota bacterium]